MVPTHLARTGALWRPGGAAERETFVGLIRAKLQRRLVGQNKVLEATPSLSLPHAYTPGYFPALDRYRGPVALRRAAMDASQGLTASWSQEPVPRRAAAGFDVEASLWQALQVDLAQATWPGLAASCRSDRARVPACLAILPNIPGLRLVGASDDAHGPGLGLARRVVAGR